MLMRWARLLCRLFHIDVDHKTRIVSAGPGGRQLTGSGRPGQRASGGVQRFVAHGLAYFRMNLAEALRPGSSRACRRSHSTLSPDA
jgi:hypothetical protein